MLPDFHEELDTPRYSYFSNGLYIASYIHFPELYEISSPYHQVYIIKGKVPAFLSGTITKSPLRQVSANEFLLDIKGVARYLVKDNSRIIIEPYKGADEDTIRLYILSTIFGVLIHKHNMLAMHASCVKIDDKAILIAGASGAGKSTLAFGLHNRGYEVLNDDISAIFFDNGLPYVYPGYVHLKLWEKSLEAYGYQITGLRKIRTEIEKYSFPIERNDYTTPVEVKGLFFISVSTGKKIEHELVSGFEAIKYIRNSTFRYKLVKEIQRTPQHFSLSSQLINKIPFIHILRPDNIKVDTFIDYLEERINEL